jgi:hypothetical protein
VIYRRSFGAFSLLVSALSVTFRPAEEFIAAGGSAFEPKAALIIWQCLAQNYIADYL